jgi:3-oxoadipate enol-lactonase
LSVLVETTQHLHRAFFPARGESDRDPLLLLNSLATTTEIWTPLLPRLTAVTDVICVDYPGHGRSPARDLPADLDALAAQIIDVVDGFGVERLHVAGVSIGGMTALRLAERYPQRIVSTTVIGSSPVMDRRLWLERKSVVRQWGTKGLVPDVLPRWFTPEYATAWPAIVSSYVAMLEGTVDAAYSAFCDVLAESDLRPGLAGVKQRTVVISGGRDLAATVDQGRMISSSVPGARQEVIDDAAHMLQAMAADRVADAIIENVIGSR